MGQAPITYAIVARFTVPPETVSEATLAVLDKAEALDVHAVALADETTGKVEVTAVCSKTSALTDGTQEREALLQFVQALPNVSDVDVAQPVDADTL